jgi:methylglyoxal synthase
MKELKKIALVAHDNRKKDLIEWVEWNWNALLNHQLICTGTTGVLVEEALKSRLDKDLVRKLTSASSLPARLEAISNSVL